jgi:hypothetical protein
MKLRILALCAAPLFSIVACKSGPAPTMSMARPTATQAAATENNLLSAIRKGADDVELVRLIESGVDLNAANAEGVTPFMALVATRSPELVKLALRHGADAAHTLTTGNGKVDAAGFARGMLGLGASADIQYQQQFFGLNGKGISGGPLNESEAARLIENIALLRARQFELQELDDDTIRNARSEFKAWSEQTQRRIDTLSAPVANIPEPALPPVQSFKKSPFETLAMFQQRMEDARKQREQQTAEILARYRKRVEARNQQVAKNSAELKKLQTEVAARNAAYQKVLDDHGQAIEKAVRANQRGFLAEAMAEVYGAPWLKAIEQDGAPKYDAERGLMFAQLGFSGLAESRELVIPVKAGPGAERFYNRLKSGDMPAIAWFRFGGSGGQVSLQSAEIDFEQANYSARLDSGERFVAQAPVEVVLQEKTAVPQLTQGAIDKVVFDTAALNNLQLQNPNIKDVQFEAFLLKEQKAFDDDIPQLLAKTPAVPVNRNNWLFVIGIGQYEQTDDILYSRRSAELFAQVASKTLGVHDSRKVILLDKQASSGAIQDQLRLMLDKVKAGDKIYFYYSGHGLPVAEKGNAPYLLPADKIPDFIASDDFYQAQSIYRLLQNSQASQVVAFMDSCFTGTTDGKSLFGGTKAATRLQPKQLRLASTDKMAVFTAGTDKQFSNALPETGHRLFSYYLMKAMLKGYDRVGDFANRVRADVSDKSLDLGGLNRQTPVLVGNPNLSLR